jgi:DNA gyrase inhibitor GyrI
MKLVLILLAIAVFLAVAGMLFFVYVIQNVETPAYEVVVRDGDFEIRDYPSMQVAEVARGGPRRQALSAGFGPLARYIFAKERGGERIAMTAPVEQQPLSDAAVPTSTPAAPAAASGDDRWAVRFIMPSRLSADALPDPANGEVRLREVPARRVAVLRFSGRTTDARIAEQEALLRTWMQRQGLLAANSPVYAYYNDPFTPGFLRRNEVMIDVAPEPGLSHHKGAGST